jgi:hypothetical protein
MAKSRNSMSEFKWSSWISPFTRKKTTADDASVEFGDVFGNFEKRVEGVRALEV